MYVGQTLIVVGILVNEAATKVQYPYGHNSNRDYRRGHCGCGWVYGHAPLDHDADFTGTQGPEGE